MRHRGLHRCLPRRRQAKAWNAGYCCGSGANDVQFARDIITWLKANTNVNAKRIYASGGSNGGAMTYALACEASDVIAAVAAVDFRCVTGNDPGTAVSLMSPSNNTACVCPNIRPITVVDWDEGGIPRSSPTRWRFRTGNRDLWARRPISRPSDTSAVARIADSGSGQLLLQTWTSCKGGVTETLCNHQSGSHLSIYSDTSADWIDVSWDRISVQKLP